MYDFRIEIFVSIRMQGKRTKKPTPYPEFIRTTANAYFTKYFEMCFKWPPKMKTVCSTF